MVSGSERDSTGTKVVRRVRDSYSGRFQQEKMDAMTKHEQLRYLIFICVGAVFVSVMVVALRMRERSPLIWAAASAPIAAAVFGAIGIYSFRASNKRKTEGPN